jgi:hypothetical protein
MYFLSADLFTELITFCHQAGRADLLEKLYQTKPNNLTSTQAASYLGLASPKTIENWLEGGFFPGAFQTAAGDWLYPVEEVTSVKQRMNELKDLNQKNDLVAVDFDDNAIMPPLL